MKLVVGLGNPGSQYQGTRHNVGFEVLAELSRRWSGGKPQLKFQSELVEISGSRGRWLLMAPQTYMNLSGQAVQAAVQFYKIELDDVLVICDDLNLDPGRLRLRANGSAGGQKGLANIIQLLGTDQVSRLRIGIGRPPGQRSAVDYVLGRFSSDEKQTMTFAVEEAATAVEVWADQGLETAMNRFNAGTSN